METFLNILILFFAVSGFFGWVLALLVLWYHWICSPNWNKS
jgi:hypothetical protein